MGLNIVSERPVSMVEVRQHLEKAKKDEGELNFRSQKALEHVEQFAKMPAKKAQELIDVLKKLELPRLRDVHFIKLVDLLPTAENDVKIVLQGYNITIASEKLKKIAETIADFVAKK